MRMLQARGMQGQLEVLLSLPGAYLSYYVGQVYMGASGCIATVAFGLWGNASLVWGMSASTLRHDLFFGFWDVALSAINGLIFFYVGSSATNFTIRWAVECMPTLRLLFAVQYLHACFLLHKVSILQPHGQLYSICPCNRLCFSDTTLLVCAGPVTSFTAVGRMPAMTPHAMAAACRPSSSTACCSSCRPYTHSALACAGL